ncbi:hypothetical protein [Erwinia rhapontici]|uniref:hypothetical protein n=1 Tax=Erwinia rhapontici TaxID=55212 RepID=UPI003B9E20D6
MLQLAANHLDVAAINESWLAKTARTPCLRWHYLYLLMNMSGLGGIPIEYMAANQMIDL